MATENILIKFTADTSGITKSIDELQKMGKVTEDDAKKLAMLEGIAEGVADALKEAGVDAKNLNKQVTESVNSGKSLRTQFSEAKNEAVKLSKEFGAFSKEAREAAKRAALIKDEIADLNANLDALNPEAKLNAFVNLGQGIQGAFQVATGALQVFGVENERITKLAQQFQGVLNLTQGINSVLQLKDVYTQLRLVLGVTTAAQSGLNAAMLANPFVLVATAVAGLVAALIILENKTEEYAITEEQLNKIKEAGIGATDDLADAEDALAIQRDKNATFNIQRRKAQNDLEQSLIVLYDNQRIAQDELTEATRKYNELGKDAAIGVKRERTERLSLAIETKRLTDQAIIDKRNEFAAIRTTITLKEQEANAQDKVNQKKNDAKKVEEETIRLMQLLGLEAALTNDEIVNISDEAFTKMEDALRTVNANAFEVKKNIVAINKELKNLSVVSVDIKKTGTQLNQELIKSTDDTIEAEDKTREYLFASAQQLNSAILNVTKARDQREIQSLDEKRKRGLISEEKYQQEIKKIQSRAASAEKQAAIFSALIGIANGIINALNSKTVPVPVAVGIASAIGAAQLAAIIATPIPKFKKGTLNVGGGSLDSDGGMHAIIHRGEAVIPADRNREYHPTIKALYNRQIKASDINAFVQSKLSGKMNHNVNAKINTKELARAMSGSENVNIKNSGLLAKQIGREIAGHYNPRRR